MIDKNLQSLGEFGLIEHLNRALARRDGVRVGIGDDGAVLSALSCPVITCDCLVENVHLRRDWISPRQLGRKTLAVNVSDLAAMKARPVAAFVTLALSAHDDLAFIEELYAGLEEIARDFSFTIAGGDTARTATARTSGVLMLSVTLIGESSTPVLRSGAQVGDVVLVTGTLGDSAAGLALLQNPELADSFDEDKVQFLIQRHLDPTPRLREIMSLSDNWLHAALDLSDGLAGDAQHIAQQSQVDIEIDLELLPISSASEQAARLLKHRVLDWATGGGEDYELLLCVAPENAGNVMATIQNATGTRVTKIGRCVKTASEPRVVLRHADGSEATSRAWTHF